ncbi:MAG TPA: hypothetical protein VHL11_16545, partial [Phototrophicaceae bacterium]|nr:hypothetical protein [Phototrophicaceae bacterium]
MRKWLTRPDLMLMTLIAILTAGLVIATAPLAAQGAPEQIQDALALFNQETGQNLTLNDLYWTWDQLTATDSSLGCPKDGETYTQGQVVVYRFLFTWQGNIYEYRVSADRTTTRSCGAISQNAPTPTLSPNTTATPDPQSNILCPPQPGITYMRTRLTVGIKGHVPLGAVTNVRSDPASTAPQIGQITGSEFDILAGPQCDTEGYLWWQISNSAITGWMAEGKDGEYFFEPLPPSAGLTGLPVINLGNVSTLSGIDKIQGNFSRKLSFESDGKLVIVGDGGSEGAWIYDTLNATPRIMPATLPLTAIGFCNSSSGQTLGLFGGTDGAVRLWDLRPDIPVTERVYLLGHDDPVSAAACKSDGSLMASSGGLAYTTQNDAATDTYAIVVWDINSVSFKTALRGHTGEVTGLVFMPDGSLISASQDGSLRWWDVNTSTQLAMIQAETPATSLALSPDGTLLVAGYGDGSITAYRPISATAN